MCRVWILLPFVWLVEGKALCEGEKNVCLSVCVCSALKVQAPHASSVLSASLLSPLLKQVLRRGRSGE